MFDECNLTRSSRPAGAVVTAPGPGLSSHDGLALACHCRLTCSESHWRSSAKGLGPVAASTLSAPSQPENQARDSDLAVLAGRGR